MYISLWLCKSFALCSTSHTHTHTRMKSPKAQIMSGRNVLPPTGILNRQILRFANSPHWSLFMKDSHMKVLPYIERARIKDAVRRAHMTLSVLERACVYVGGWVSCMCNCLFVCLLACLQLQPDAFLWKQMRMCAKCIFIFMGIWARMFTCYND